MAIVVKDRVKVTTATTGTGTLTLGSAETDFQAFSVIGDGNQTYYAIKSDAGWEVGIGTYTHSGTTLSRDTILESSNSGSAVSLTGTSTVFTTYPAERGTFNDQGIAKEYTATGSITAGKPVILKADGTAEQVVKETTTNNYDPQDATAEVTSPNGEHWYTSNTQYNSTQGVLLFGNSSNSDYYPYITPATANADGSLNLGTSTVIESTTTYGGYVTTNTQANEFLYTWNWAGNTSGIRMKAGTIGGTSTAPTVSLGSMVQVDSKQGYYHNTCYDSNVDRYVTMLLIDNSGGQTQGQCWAYNISVSGTTPSVNNSGGTQLFTSYNSVGGYSSPACQCAFDPSANRVLIKANGISSDGGSTFKVMMQVIELTTTGINGASNTPVILDSDLSSSSGHAQSESWGSMVYNPDTNKMLVGYILRGASDSLTRGKLRIATVGSTSVTFGAVTTIDSNPCNCVITGYDENLNKFSVIRDSSSYSPQSSSFYNMTVDGSDNITLSSEVVLNASGYLTCNNNYGATLAYDPNAFALYQGLSSSSDYYIYSFQSKNETTTINLDSTNYLGVASTPASNGEKVNINLPELSINNSQSGLTVGDDYFCNTSGEIKKFMTSSTTPDTTPTGAFATMDGSDTASEEPSSVYESTSGTFVIAYRDGSNGSKGTAVAGTWSNGTMTWGTPVVFENSAIDDQPKICAGGGRVHITYRDSSGNGGIKSGSISGTTLTFGSETVFASSGDSAYANPMGYHVAYDTSTNYIIIFYQGGSASVNTYVQPVHFDTSSYAYTLGTTTTVYADSLTSRYADIVFDPDTNRTVILYTDGTNSNYKTANVVQSTGTSGSPTVSVGADSVIASVNSSNSCMTYDTQNNKVFAVYKDDTDSNAMKGSIGTVTGGGTNTIAFTTPAEVWNPSGNPNNVEIEFDSDNNEAFFFYRDEDSGDDFTYKIITIGASSFTVASGGVLSANDNRFDSGSASFGTGKGVLCATSDSGNSQILSYGTVYYGVVTTYTQTDAQYIGEAISTTALKLKETPTDIIFGKASNTIAKGNPVIVEADGDFAKAETVTESFAQGTAGDITEAYRYGAMSYDPDEDKYIYFYKAWTGSESGKLCYRLGTPSGSGTSATITWGSQTELVSGVYIEDTDQSVSACYDTTNKKTVVIYENSGVAQLRSTVVTISGTTVTATSEVTIDTNNPAQTGIVYASNYSKVVAVWYYSSYYYVSVGTIDSSGVISWTSAQNSYVGTISAGFSITYDATQNAVVISYQDAGNSNYGTSAVGELNSAGSSVSFGSEVVFYSNYARVYAHNLTTDTENNKIINCYRDNTGSGVGKCQVGTVTGNSISWGSAVQFNGSVAVGNPAVAYNDNADVKKSMVVFQQQTGSYYLGVADITVSGTTPTITSTTDLTTIGSSTYSADANQILPNSANKQFAIASQNNNREGDYIVVSPEQSQANLTTENFVGLADIASTANGTSKVRINGVDANNTGLTAGQLYYVKNDGTLSETAESGKVVEAGKALSATKLLVKG